MSRIIGICNLHDEPDLGILTENRPLGAVSFLGRYGLIDFALSNFSNSGIDRIAVLVENNMHSIRSHIGNGSVYLNNTRIGFLRLLMNEKALSSPFFNTDVNNILANAYRMEDAKSDYVIVTNAHFLFSFDFQKLIKEHIKSNADVTMMYTRLNDLKEYMNCNVLTVDGKQKVQSLKSIGAKENEGLVSLETYIFDEDVFVNMVNNANNISRSCSLKQALAHAINNKYCYVRGYEFKGDVCPIMSLQSYVEQSFKCLAYDYRKTFFQEDWPIYTSTHNTPPALYGENSNVKNSFVANGSRVHGTVENSILSRDVIVEEGAVIRNSILFTKTVVGKGIHIDYVLTDKNVKILKEKKISGKKNDLIVIEQGANL